MVKFLAKSKKANKPSTGEAAIDCEALRQMVENMPINVMVCDLANFQIIYANKATLQALKQLEHVLDIKADQLVGTCIDVFHKNAAHQRSLLSNPKNLPHQANIEIGGEILDLLVTAVYDSDGTYIFPMVTWSVITEKVKADAEAHRLLQMVDNMPINVMMCDPVEFKLNYVNATSRKTLQSIEHLLPCQVDALMGQCIDVFHKNPTHQRSILANPKNLPHNAKIELGEETLSLNVSAVTDKSGEYLGPMVCWSVITGQVKLANNFENNVKSVVELASSATTELRSTAESMSSVADESNSQANSVAAAAQQASTNVETVASAAEELSASIKEISDRVANSAEIASKASTEAKRTDETIKGLAEAVNKIGKVVDLINDIAEQTNLLALNATIEAARAGDAGKGFAVVANEVKSLATETGKATGEIAAQISSIQSVSNDAVKAIQEIDKTIQDMNEIATSVSAAIEEQTAATAEIARNVQQASAGTGEVTNNVSGLSQAASETGQSASQVLESAGELAKQMTTLKDQVDGFLVEVRAL
ncbi:methyl-accepting chemotaxis protein [Pelagibius sp.]|uniref:methyl-accepting chemotaxis protein n=1 Tax=Pelagibius sp. TaxID=1931238 RepID=UPI00260BB583|nr:methyl-accepting chemotaxis protein [Pelagibius sp.]